MKEMAWRLHLIRLPMQLWSKHLLSLNLHYNQLNQKQNPLKNIKVLDVGGGTGHTHCSFFQFPEEIEYYLLDPNLRLLHDQFLRLYPKLS